MSVVLQVLEIIAPVFVIAGIGVAWVAMGLEYHVQFVTRLTMTLAAPCLIFTSLVRTEIDPQALRDTALAAVVAYLAVAAVVFGLVKLARLDVRTFFAPLVFGNTGNLGLPLALFAFGNAGFDLAVVVFAVMSILSFTFGVWIVSGSGNPLTALKEPIVWGTIFGGIFLVMGWTLPEWSMNTLSLIGQMLIPIMLITLGVAVARLRPDSFRRATWLSALKYVICIAVPWGIGLLFNLPPVAHAALVMQVATPVAVTSYMLAAKYKADSDEVASMVVVSTVMGIAVLPLLIGFLI